MAAAGIYGVMAHLVSLRTPEIGVRLTLGASPLGVMRQVLGEGAMQAAIGLVIGLGASLALMRGCGRFCSGSSRRIRLTLASVGVSLMFVALLAVAVPALRAMRVDPVTALRRASSQSQYQRRVLLATGYWILATTCRPRLRRTAGDRRRPRACCPSG